MNLVYKHEKPLFTIAAVIAAIFWIVLIVGTVGLALLWILLAFVLYVVAQSAFISHLKGNGVKITPEQYPDLHQRLVRCSNHVDQDDIPDAYLLRTDFFNALATRFLGRNFIVLFTDVVDALEPNQDAIDFYIGHELGHIHRNHLLWNSFLAPAKVLPLLGAGLRRAEEYTCDLYGSACCQSEDDIKAAIAAIAAGDSRWESINVDSYIKQIKESRGFWMSYHELTGDYPWLTKRMASALAAKRGDTIQHPKRNIFAWILAALTPRLGVGGGGVVFTVMIIGILAAIAIPAYQTYAAQAVGLGDAFAQFEEALEAESYEDYDYEDYSSYESNPETYSPAYQEGAALKAQVASFYAANKAWPDSLLDIGYDEPYSTNTALNSEIGLYEDGIIGIQVDLDSGAERYIVIEPNASEGGIEWLCYGQDIPDETALPEICQ